MGLSQDPDPKSAALSLAALSHPPDSSDWLLSKPLWLPSSATHSLPAGDFLKIQIWPCHWCFIPLLFAPHTLPKTWSPSALATRSGSLTTVPLAHRTSHWLSLMFLNCTMNSVDSRFENGWTCLYSRSSLPFIWLTTEKWFVGKSFGTVLPHLSLALFNSYSSHAFWVFFFSLNYHDFLFLYTWHLIAPSTGTNWLNTAHHSVSTPTLWVHFSYIC